MEELQTVILVGKSVSGRTASSPKCLATIFVRHVERLGCSSSNLNWRIEVRKLEHCPRACVEFNIRDLGPRGHRRFKSNHSSLLCPHLYTKGSSTAAYSISSSCQCSNGKRLVLSLDFKHITILNVAS